jgi:GntR family transcriptional regulator
MQKRNVATGSQLIEFGEIVASRRLAELLDLEIGNPIYRVVILRLANRVPVILERGFFPCVHCPKLEDWDLEKTSIIDLLTTVYRIKPGRISQTVEAVPASEPITKQLRVEDGFPLLMLSRTIYNDESGKPIVFSQDFLRSDYARVHSDVSFDEITPSTDII